jgi:hypothetical protein
MESSYRAHQWGLPRAVDNALMRTPWPVDYQFDPIQPVTHEMSTRDGNRSWPPTGPRPAVDSLWS